MTTTTTLDAARVARLQRRVVRALSAGQVLGGVGAGATISLGPLLIVAITGSEGLSGLAATTGTLGAAMLAIPLARLAQSRGRRVSLTTGAILAALGGLFVIASAGTMSLPLLLVGLSLMGAAQALNLQARFAAADLAADRTRGRDLSLVVWSTTIGVVLGPNLFGPGEVLGTWFGLPEMSGGFAISVAAQVVGIVLFLVFLRPDPLLTAAAIAARGDDAVAPRPSGALRVLRRNRVALRAVVTIALSHAVMISLMSMTPVHMTGHGSALAIVGLTVSLHMAGMYALAPVFGWLTDRWGARAVILGGQVLSALALVAGVLGSLSEAGVIGALILLGLGWSASTVAGSTLVTASVAPAERPRVQGASDTLMNLAGAIGGASAGPVLAAVGFQGLAAVLLVPVAIVVVMHLRRAF
ncbi:MFS transporter [Nocardiopsis aegyptia]|uniref:MFS transporter n=1 Tax=Nocardiopsis aegyptia TaxID=220378 RepID=UPI00366A56D7